MRHSLVDGVGGAARRQRARLYGDLFVGNGIVLAAYMVVRRRKRRFQRSLVIGRPGLPGAHCS
jgi:hypothetical protein